MAPKSRKPTAAAVAAAAPGISAAAVPPPSSSTSNPLSVFNNVFDSYMQSTPSRTKLIDVFLVFLVLTGVVQFAYCVIAGNYVRPPGVYEGG